MHEAVDNVTPYMEVRQIKVGGKSKLVEFLIWFPLTWHQKKIGFGDKMNRIFARRRREIRMWIKLTWELVDSALRRSEAWKKKNQRIR
ncbi:MAG: hypothetical protein ACTS4U_01985 [Candidatus Hodgkinia cicadicola]